MCKKLAQYIKMYNFVKITLGMKERIQSYQAVSVKMHGLHHSFANGIKELTCS